MNEVDALVDIQIPKKIWIELHDGDNDARDVIVEMENGMIYTAVFVTLSFLSRQMDLTHELCKQIPDTAPTSFAALDTPHIVVASLERDVIEDTIDNLLAMDVFEGVFTQVTEAEEDTTTTTTNRNGRRATQEVAAVVLSDVLVVEE